MQLEDFNLMPEVIGILRDRLITEEREILFILEQYKFKSREDIIFALKDQQIDSSDNFSFNPDGEQIICSIDGVHRNSKLADVEKRYSIIMDEVSETEANVICEYGSTHDRTAIELNVPYQTLNFVYVTPFNFKNLWEPDEDVVYDPDILLKRIILECINRKGTDLHLTVHHVEKKPVYKVMYRRNGVLCNLNLFKITKELNKGMVYSLIGRNTDKDTLDLLSANGVTALAPDIFGDHSVELRVSANRIKDGYECVARIQSTQNVTLQINQLGFPKDVQEDLYRLANKQFGITLITGPIRTGKNTTAFALANEMSKRPVKIKSFESPIEALMNFPQLDYFDDPNALREAIRLAKKQDINIAFLNEIPNKEVAFAVKDLVNSSVYVITTMHVNRIWHLPYKLFELYGESYKDVICQLNGVVNQKMFGVLCPHCLDTVLVSELKDLRKKELLLKYGVNTVYIPKGCDLCSDPETGLCGTIIGSNQPYVERLIFTDDIKSQLMRCKEPFEMEDVIRHNVLKNNAELERAICDGIAAAKLSVDALDSVL